MPLNLANLKLPKGKLNISKSIKLLPGVRLRWGLNTGAKLVLGGSGITYSIPIPGTKLKDVKENVKGLLPERLETDDDESA